MVNVFISDCKTKFIATVNGCPAFLRTSHLNIIKSQGLSVDNMENLTSKFFFTGKGQSIKTFLNS